jgi:cytidylate kinase
MHAVLRGRKSASSAPARPAPLVIVLSGAVCTGKTALGERLASDGASLVNARSALLARAGSHALGRAQLHSFAASLERDTDGRWLADALPAPGEGGSRAVVVDAAETRAQLSGLRSYAGAAPCHIHLEAARHERQRRFAARRGRGDAEAEFAQAAAAELAGEISALAVDANLSIDTTRLSAEGVALVARAYLRALGG